MRKRDVDRLIDALSTQQLVDDGQGGVVDLSAQTRVDALAAISQLPALDDERILEAVLGRLEDPIPEVREIAVRLLSAMRPDVARQYLIRGLLSWPEPYGQARLEAAKALQEAGDPTTPDLLIEAIATGNGSTRLDGLTRRAISSVTPDGADRGELADSLIERLRRGEGNPTNLEILLAWLGESSVAKLIQGLDDPLIRVNAATVLGALRESRAVPGLVRCLEDGSPDARLAAARALREIRDVRGVDGLIRAVSDEDFAVRCEAQEALDSLGTVGVIAGVSAVLQIVMNEHRGELPRPAESEDQPG